MPLRSLGLHFFCVAGIRLFFTAKDLMYVLASCGASALLRNRCGTMWIAKGQIYALAFLGTPPLLCGRRGIMCAAKGSDIYPGFPWDFVTFAW